MKEAMLVNKENHPAKQEWVAGVKLGDSGAVFGWVRVALYDQDFRYWLTINQEIMQVEPILSVRANVRPVMVGDYMTSFLKIISVKPFDTRAEALADLVSLFNEGYFKPL